VPTDHLVRQIDGVLDLGWVHKELAPYYSHRDSAASSETMHDETRKLATATSDPAWAGGDPIPSRVIPESWHCIDCGVNTAPGLLNRAEAEKAFAADDNCRIEQTIDDKSEIYCVRKEVWAETRLDCYGGCLCIRCLESRLGRLLEPRDFQPDHRLNWLPGTERLMKRREG
jgi:hypothetical protein